MAGSSSRVSHAHCGFFAGILPSWHNFPFPVSQSSSSSLVFVTRVELGRLSLGIRIPKTYVSLGIPEGLCRANFKAIPITFRDRTFLHTLLTRMRSVVWHRSINLALCPSEGASLSLVQCPPAPNPMAYLIHKRLLEGSRYIYHHHKHFSVSTRSCGSTPKVLLQKFRGSSLIDS